MTRTNGYIITALLITLSVSLAQGGVKTRSAASEGKEGLNEIRDMASAVENDADDLKTFIEDSQYSPESHLGRLMAMKEQVNKMGKEIGVLEAERESLPIWEQQAMDKVLPLAREVAANTESAIQFFNENRNFLWSRDYRDEADQIQRDSERIAKIVKTYVKYDTTRQKEEQLRKDVGASSD